MIDYCSPCCDNLSVSDCIKLERLQRRAALTGTGAITRSGTDKLCFEVVWPKLGYRRKSFRMNLLYKIINYSKPDYLFDDFFLKLSASSCKLSIPFCKQAKYALSSQCKYFQYRCVNCLNKMLTGKYCQYRFVTCMAK